METRICRLCGVEKPLTDYYPKTGRKNPMTHCKVCHNTRTQQWYRANLEENRAKGRERARENSERMKAYGAVYREQNREKLRAKGVARYHANREKLQQQGREYKAANAEEIRAKAAAYREANRERLREKAAEYYRKNRDEVLERLRKWHAEHPERSKEIQQQSRQRNAAKVAARCAKRRAILARSDENYTAFQWEELKRLVDHTCLVCKRREPEVKLSPDHVIPLARGGSNAITNIQPLCVSCNSSKHAKDHDHRSDELRESLEILRQTTPQG